MHLLEELRHFAARNPVIAVAALLVDDHHLRRRKLCEVAACGLRRDSSSVGKLARSPRAPVEHRDHHVHPCRITKQSADLGHRRCADQSSFSLDFLMQAC